MHSNREEIRRLMIAINQIDEAYYKVLRTLGIKDIHKKVYAMNGLYHEQH